MAGVTVYSNPTNFNIDEVAPEVYAMEIFIEGTGDNTGDYMQVDFAFNRQLTGINYPNPKQHVALQRVYWYCEDVGEINAPATNFDSLWIQAGFWRGGQYKAPYAFREIIIPEETFNATLRKTRIYEPPLYLGRPSASNIMASILVSYKNIDGVDFGSRINILFSDKLNRLNEVITGALPV